VVKKIFLSSFKAAKLELMMENLRWRGAAKVRMHVAVRFACMHAATILAHKTGRPELANSHRSLHTLNAQKRLRSRNQAKEELMTTITRFMEVLNFQRTKKEKGI